MANKRSEGGSRNRDIFRNEVASFLADLGELAEELGPPPRNRRAEPERTSGEDPGGSTAAEMDTAGAADLDLGASVTAPLNGTVDETAIAAMALEATGMALPPAMPTPEASVGAAVVATVDAATPMAPPEESGGDSDVAVDHDEAAGDATSAVAAAPASSWHPAAPATGGPDGERPSTIEPEAEQQPGEVAAGMAQDPPASAAADLLVNIEDLPSFSPSYLPPFPPAVDEVAAAGSPAGATAGPAAEAGTAQAAAEPRLAEPQWLAATDDFGAPPTAHWRLESAEGGSGQAAEPVDDSEPEMGAAAAGEPADRVVEPRQSVAGDEPSRVVGSPGWRVREPALPAEPVGTRDLAGGLHDFRSAGADPEPDGAPLPGAGLPESAAEQSPESDPPAELPGHGATALPGLAAHPAASASAGDGEASGGHGARLGPPPVHGGVPVLISSRPWTLAAAMEPLAPFSPPLPRQTGAVQPEATTVQPAAPPGRRSLPRIRVPAVPAVLIALLALIVLLIVLRLSGR